MTDNQQFWNKLAKYYNAMFASNKDYRKMYRFVKESLTENMCVLEVGTGTGMVARNIADKVKSVEATDYSETMIEKAKLIEYPVNVYFSCADVFNLPYQNNHFDAVIASNLLHIIPEPQKALTEIARVLKPKGVFVAPTFMWQQADFIGKIKRFIMQKRNFPIQTKWNQYSFINFLTQNTFEVQKKEIIKSNFTMICVQCVKKKCKQ